MFLKTILNLYKLLIALTLVTCQINSAVAHIVKYFPFTNK